MAWSWTARYRSYEQRCLMADKLPEGRKRAAAFRRLSKQYDRLCAERPQSIAASVSTDIEDARDNLLAALIHSKCNRTDRRLLRIWLNKDCQIPPPPIEDSYLNKLVQVVVWVRDHASQDPQSAQVANISQDAVQNGPIASGNSDRNKWLFEQRSQGISIPKLQAELSLKCKDTGWYPLDSPSGIRLAILRHATDHGLKAPIGKPGRPRKTTKP